MKWMLYSRENIEDRKEKVFGLDVELHTETMESAVVANTIKELATDIFHSKYKFHKDEFSKNTITTIPSTLSPGNIYIDVPATPEEIIELRNEYIKLLEE